MFSIHRLSFIIHNFFTMAITHFPAMLLFSLLTSVVFGVLSKNTPRERIIYGAKVFVAFVGIAILLGWIMYPLSW